MAEDGPIPSSGEIEVNHSGSLWRGDPRVNDIVRGSSPKVLGSYGKAGQVIDYEAVDWQSRVVVQMADGTTYQAWTWDVKVIDEEEAKLWTALQPDELEQVRELEAKVNGAYRAAAKVLRDAQPGPRDASYDQVYEDYMTKVGETSYTMLESDVSTLLIPAIREFITNYPNPFDKPKMGKETSSDETDERDIPF